jgi:hypothetical protein
MSAAVRMLGLEHNSKAITIMIIVDKISYCGLEAFKSWLEYSNLTNEGSLIFNSNLKKERELDRLSLSLK